MSSAAKALAGIAATITMLSSVSVASANNLSISHGNLWNAVFHPFRLQSSGVTAAACDLTLEGSFHSSTMRKVERALIGHISRATINNCRSGSATVLTETLPWHLQYAGFAGTLPLINEVRILAIGMSFRFRDAIFGSICLARTTTTNPGVLVARAGGETGGGNLLISSIVADPLARIPCGSLSGGFEGSGTFTELPFGDNLLIQLI